MEANEQKTPELVYSNDGEIYRFEDLRDLIEDHDLQVGDVVFVGEKSPLPASAYISAESIVDQMHEQAMDMAGEAAEDFPDVSDEAFAELETLLSEWANKHCAVSFYPVINDREYRITQADIDSLQ